MSKTPLVKTIGRGNAATRAASSTRGQSLSMKWAIVAHCRLRVTGLGAGASRLSPLPDGEASMITLCGSPISNYYNKVKMVLLEKGVPFVEERVAVQSREEPVLAASPLWKIPFIRTEHGTMCESQAIV